jgi:hypothetical protein
MFEMTMPLRLSGVRQGVFDREDPAPGLPVEHEVLAVQAERAPDLIDLVDVVVEIPQGLVVGLVAERRYRETGSMRGLNQLTRGYDRRPSFWHHGARSVKESRGGFGMRLLRVGVLMGLVTLAVYGLAASSALAIQTPPPGDPPPVCGAFFPGNCLIQTRNGGFHLSGHIVRAGGELTGTVTNRCTFGDGDDSPCAITWGAMTAAGKVVHGCESKDTTCTIKIPKDAQTGDYQTINIVITNVQGGGYSSDYFAVVGRHDSVIQGQISNKNKSGAPGLVVDMFGQGNGPSYEATTGQDGHYAATVKAGHYRVFPSAKSVPSKTEVKFTPSDSTVHAPPNASADADFELDSGLVVTLDLSDHSVPADGMHIVKAKVHVTQYGKPVVGQTVALMPQPDETSAQSLTSGPRVLMCTTGGRIWPTGSLNDPDGIDVDEVTDANGNYTFTLDVGTVPGSWKLTAWAKDASGSLITADTRNTSDDQTLTVDPVSAHAAAVDDFVPEYNRLASSTGLVSGISDDLNTMLGDFIKLSRTQTQQGGLGGLAYAPASQGAILIYQAASTPHIAKDNTVTARTGDLVLQPSDWTTVPKVAFASLDAELTGGRLQALPTFAQWTSGTSVPSWTGNKSTMTLPSTAFQYFGWPYPNTATGSCS